MKRIFLAAMVLLAAQQLKAQDVTYTEKKDEITDEVLVHSNFLLLTPKKLPTETESTSGVLFMKSDSNYVLQVSVYYQGDPIMCIGDKATLYLKATDGELLKVEDIVNSDADGIGSSIWNNSFLFRLTKEDLDFIRIRDFSILRVETDRSRVTSKINPKMQGALSKLINVYFKIYKEG